MALDKSSDDNANDLVHEQDGVKVVISKEYKDYYKNIKIEWIDDYRGRGFSVYDTMNTGC